MKKITYLILFLTTFVLSQPAMAAERSRNNYVDWIVASAHGTSTSHFIQWKNQIHPDCQNNRTRFSMEDNALMSLLLSAKMSGKRVGFHYDLTATTTAVPGHVSHCQIINAWLEPD